MRRSPARGNARSTGSGVPEDSRRLRALSEICARITALTPMDALLRSIAAEAARLLGVETASFRVVDGEDLLLIGMVGPDPETSFRSRIGIGESLAGRVVAENAPFVARLDDVASSVVPEHLAIFRRRGDTHFLGVPVRAGHRLLGALTARAAREFSADDVALAETFAAQAAVALENARLYEEADRARRQAEERAREAREYAERLRALDGVNRLVSSSLNIDAVLANLAQAAVEFFDAAAVSVWRFDPATRRLYRAVFRGDPELGDAARTELALGEGVVGWCVRHREPIVWADVADDPRAVEAPLLVARGLRYFTAFPIAIGDRVLGAFVVYRATPSRVAGETASLLGSLAAQAAVALDHARLFSDTTRRLEETAALLEVTEILGSTLELKQLLKRVAIKVAQVCRVDRCSIDRWDGERVLPLMSQFADGRERPDLWEAFKTLVPRPSGVVPAHARAIETRRPVIIDDTATTTDIPREWVDVFGPKAYMTVPLVAQDRVIGLMSLDYSERQTAFEQWQADLAMTIAGQVALAIENSRLYEEAQARLHETTVLLAVGRALSEPGPVDEVMRRVAREVARAFGAESVGAFLVDDRRESLIGIAGHRVPRELREHFPTRPLRFNRLPEIASALREGRAVWSADPFHDARFDQEWLAGLPEHSVIFAAATVHGEPVGALFLVWWHGGRTFSATEVRLVEAVARQVGLAMENVELARQREVKLRETEVLLSVSRVLSSTLDLQRLLRHFLRQVARTIEADSVGVWTLAPDGEWLEPLAGYRVPPAVLEAARRMRWSIVADPFYAEAARTRRAVFSHDAMSDPRIPDGAKRAAPHRTQLFVPIVVNERMIGGFAALWWERVRHFSDGDLALMEAIANQAGVAIEHARLFQENRRQLDELRALHELSRAVTGELDKKALLKVIHMQVAHLLDVRDLFVALRGESDLAVFVRDAVADPSMPRSLVPNQGLLPVVMRTGVPIRTADYLGECRRRGVDPVPEAARLGRWLGVPMRAGDTVLGAIIVGRVDPPFTDADERLLSDIADLAALALKSATLYEERARAYEELAAAQDQLVRTEKLRALGEMASGVAHDFNNLLTAILGRTQLALGRVSDERLRRWLQIIERAALDGAKTVRRLQEFTRIRRDEPLVPVELNEVVHDALAITQSRWREEPHSRGVTIEARTELADVPVVAGDAAELREALTNLILNAVDAMPDGGTLTARTARAGDGVELTVADTGVGMPEGVKARLFDPFFTTKGPRGTGLGLSITYGILSRHGVEIDVETEEGRGTTFRLLFPPAGVLADAALPAATTPEPGQALLACLVVDDDPAVGAVIADMIDANGHRVVLLEDGAAAIERFRAEPFDVVFTDLAMPGVSGWDVARAVKSRAPHVPVFMITGFGVELTDEERREHGVHGVLGKPVKVEDLAGALAQAQRHRLKRELNGGPG